MLQQAPSWQPSLSLNVDQLARNIPRLALDDLGQLLLHAQHCTQTNTASFLLLRLFGMKLNKFSSSHRKCKLNLCQKRDSQFGIGGHLLANMLLCVLSIGRIRRNNHGFGLS
ncbi:hypothetical protein K439DRAFT_1628407 [Ramaria rubella]|nr:hypothetical protein K439DRAFT_1628407 [Ramaria rubella]